MSSKRPVVLMAILLLLLGAYAVRPYAEALYYPAPNTTPVVEPTGPLPAANGISKVSVVQAPDGRWMATVDYAYTGEPKNAMVRIFQVVAGASAGGAPIDWQVGGRSAQPGTHSFTREVFNPNVHEMYITQKVFGQLDVAPAPPIAKVAVDHRIQWPDPLQVEVDQALAAGKEDAIVQKAVDLIDTNNGGQLQRARSLLQTLVDRRPQADAAYVELARVAMKTQWNPTGLRQSEALLQSALQIRPDSRNAKILLGYVYAHQGRYKESEAVFKESAAVDGPNLWLWANWGEVLAMQGKTDASIQKYREAVTRPPTRDTYDNARRHAYWNLLRLLEQKGDFDGIEALLKQRSQDYAGEGCFAVDHASFLALQRADAAGALQVMRDTPSPRCNEARRRLVQALAQYVTWSQGKDPGRVDALRQARAFEPVSPTLFYSLASSDKALPVARQLLQAGEKLDMQDEQQFDALAYALRNGEIATARRLLRLGASPQALVGPEKMPAALIPVIARNLEGIRLMQGAGVDYAKLRYQGTTALDYARNEGDAKLLQLLDPKAGRI